jgi:hypothetical protein
MIEDPGQPHRSGDGDPNAASLMRLLSTMTDVVGARTPWRLGRVPATAVPAGIYGTVICASILASADGQRPVRVAVVVLVTLFVYWLAERYSEVLGLVASADGAGPVHGTATVRITSGHIRHVIRSGWPMIEASVTPSVVLLGSRLLGASAGSAVDIALWYTVVLLVVLGWLAATRAELVGWPRLVATAFAAVLGLVVVGLKASLH